MAAAEEILVRTGDQDAVSIRAVADAVGVTPPSIYLHFADKSELLHAVCEQHFLKLDDVLRAAGEAAEDPLERLAQLGLAYLRFGLDNPEAYRILFLSHPKWTPHDHSSSDLEEMLAFGRAVAAVKQGMDEDVLQPGDARITAIGLWAMVHGLVSLFISKPNVDWGDRERLAEALCHQHLTGLLTDTARRRYPEGIPTMAERAAAGQRPTPDGAGG